MIEKAALFDLDGTIAKSLPHWKLASEQALQNHPGTMPTEAEIMHTLLPNLGTIAQFGHPNPGQFILEVLAHLEPLAQEITLHDEVFESLEALRKLGIPMAIVTSSSPDWAHKLLSENGCESYFETIVTRQDVKHTKPDPEPLLLALQRLGVPKSRYVAMIGDAPSDMKAGKKALVTTIYAHPRDNHPFYSQELVQSLQADYVITRFSELLPIIAAL